MKGKHEKNISYNINGACYRGVNAADYLNSCNTKTLFSSMSIRSAGTKVRKN